MSSAYCRYPLQNAKESIDAIGREEGREPHDEGIQAHAGRGYRRDQGSGAARAGAVVAVGDNVTRFSAGDRVAGCFFCNWVDGPPSVDAVRIALGGASTDGM